MPITVNAGDPNARAANATQLKYGAQQSQIERALAQLAGTRASDEASINQYGQGGRTAINETFEQLFGNLETNRQLTQSGLATQANAVGGGYRDANQIAEAARSQAIDRLAKMYGNNGAYAAVQFGDAASPIERLAAQVTGENAQSDATVTGNLRTYAAQQDALSRMGISGAQRDKSNRLSGFETELLRALATAKNQATEQEYGYQSKMTDLLGERGQYQNEIGQQYADQAFGQQLQAAQFNLSESEASSQAQDRAASRALQERSAALQERAFDADQAAKGSDDYWKALDYELKARGMSADESNDARNFLMQEQQSSQADRQYAASYIADAQQQAMAAGLDPGEAAQQAVDQLYEMGIGNIDKYKTTQGKVGLNVGVSASGSARTSGGSGGSGTGYGSRAVQPTTTNRGPVYPVAGNMTRWAGL